MTQEKLIKSLTEKKLYFIWYKKECKWRNSRTGNRLTKDFGKAYAFASRAKADEQIRPRDKDNQKVIEFTLRIEDAELVEELLLLK